jgi:hypothetical protein
VDERRRTFNTPIREPWNAPIHQILKAVDAHMALYLKYRDPWHLEKAAMLRAYLHELKSYIHRQEANVANLGEGTGREGGKA